MSSIKKRRYRPLYKNFLNLNQNIQNRQKLLKFKKRKWKTFLEKISKKPQIIKLDNLRVVWTPVPVYDQNLYFLPEFTNSFKNKFRYNLQTKQRLSMFYGVLSKKYLKTIVKSSLNQSKLTKNKINSNLFLIELLENRIDTILYRSHFVSSIRSARQLISHKQVFVNKKLITNKSFKLKNGDLIELSPKIHRFIEQNVSVSKFWPIPPKYLQINYKTCQILFLGNIKFIDFSIQFPFWLDLNSFIKHYER